MKHNNVELNILIKGRPISEYHHRGQVFIEGRDSSEYEVEIRNNSSVRIEAVLSVDGLSVIDGKPAGTQSSGYLIEANKSIRIPGWTLDNANVAKFAFAGKQESYATQMSGESRNNGVIGVMAFAEKYTPPVYQYTQTGYYNPYGSGMATGGGASLSPFNTAMYYSGNAINESTLGGSIHNTKSVLRGATGPTGVTGATGPQGLTGATVACAAAPGVYNTSTLSDADFHCSLSADASADTIQAQNLVQNTLGTAFGESTSFATAKVDFTRGDMLSMIVLYYDDAKGLKARGIQMVKPSKKKYQQKPDAFPAMSPEGCQPPPNWRG